MVESRRKLGIKTQTEPARALSGRRLAWPKAALFIILISVVFWLVLLAVVTWVLR